MRIGLMACTTLVAASLNMLVATAAMADQNNQHVPLQKTIGHAASAAPVASLFVINADAASMADGKLTLNGVAGNVIVFADRPVRAAGHETAAQFVARWDDGKDSFKNDPPNATVSVLGGSEAGVVDAVVVLKNPKLVDGKLSFDVDVLEGDLMGVKGEAAVFIDSGGGGGGGGGGGRGGGGGGFGGGGFGGGGGDRGGWAAGGSPGHYGWYSSNVGDGRNQNDYRPCGYHPFPPCPNY